LKDGIESRQSLRAVCNPAKIDFWQKTIRIWRALHKKFNDVPL